jgi:hypothetical protein
MRCLLAVAILVATLWTLGIFCAANAAHNQAVTEYREDGTLLSETHHDTIGRLHGKATIYDSDGCVTSVTTYYHGIWVSQVEYDRDGTRHSR